MSISLTPAKPINIMNNSITKAKPAALVPGGAVSCTNSIRATIKRTSPVLMPISKCFLSIVLTPLASFYASQAVRACKCFY